MRACASESVRRPGICRRSDVFAQALAYHAVRLAWSVWLAMMLPKWIGWGWQCFGAGGYWKKRAKKASA